MDIILHLFGDHYPHAYIFERMVLGCPAFCFDLSGKSFRCDVEKNWPVVIGH
ncbi:MAG: hypothetical protein ACI8P3_004641, partial [Saprospiraceae bacterium]